MLAPGNYVQWKSRIKRYIDTKHNNKLILYCLQNPPYTFKWAERKFLIKEGSSKTTIEGIDNDIYSIFDACPNTCEMWKVIEKLKQVYHPQNYPTRYTQNSSTIPQQAATRNKGKAIVNSPPPTYDQEPKMVAKDDALSKEKDIDKLMALISLSFKRIYKPTNSTTKKAKNTSPKRSVM
ncbi:hypothetical protein Tco_0602317 [Tanacetum coccineum]